MDNNHPNEQNFAALYGNLNTDEQLAFDLIWELEHTDPAYAPAENPQGYVLGGQPGSGKSRLQKIASSEVGGNLIIANGDAYRRYHPDFEAIQVKHHDDSPKYTAEFSGKMTQLVIAKALENKYNLLVEGTFRNAETPLKTLKQMTDSGYDTHVLVKTCPKEVSWANTGKRYQAMIAAGETPRHTDQAHHDLVVNVLADNADLVFKEGPMGDFRVYNYDGILFNKQHSGAAELPGNVIYAELHNVSAYKQCVQNYEEALSKAPVAVAVQIKQLETALDISCEDLPAQERIQKKIKFYSVRLESELAQETKNVNYINSRPSL